MRRLLFATVCAVAMATGAMTMTAAPAAAAPWNIEQAAAPYKGTQLNVIFLDRPGYHAIIKLLPEFEKRTGIKVNYEIVPYENTREKEVLSFNSSGDLTLALVDLVWLGEFAENGWIVPISKFSGDASITDPNLNLKGFFPLLLDAFGTWGGKVYGLPFDNYSGLLFYNQCQLKAAGFDKPPATWDELYRRLCPEADRPGEEALRVRAAIAARRDAIGRQLHAHAVAVRRLAARQDLPLQPALARTARLASSSASTSRSTCRRASSPMIIRSRSTRSPRATCR